MVAGTDTDNNHLNAAAEEVSASAAVEMLAAMATATMTTTMTAMVTVTAAMTLPRTETTGATDNNQLKVVAKELVV